MLDAKFFRTTLPAQAKSAGAETTVEVQLLNGQTHRVRSVIEAADGYVVLEVHRRAEMTGTKMHWVADSKGEADDTFRAVVSYDAIAQVVVLPTDKAKSGRIGFGAA